MSTNTKGRPLSHSMTATQLKTASRVLKNAIDKVLDGNLSELARRCGVTPQAVQAWTTSAVVPAQRVVQVCDSLDNEIEEFQLRPDVYRAPSSAA